MPAVPFKFFCVLCFQNKMFAFTNVWIAFNGVFTFVALRPKFIGFKGALWILVAANPFKHHDKVWNKELIARF